MASDLDLDLLFGHDGGDYRVQVLRSPAGDSQSATFTWPFRDFEVENFALRAGSLRARTRRVEDPQVADAKGLGGRLFDAVFSGPVGECLRRSVDRAREDRSVLRVRLRLGECPELADLPWELLYDRADNSFLALSRRTPIIRHMQMPVRQRLVRGSLPLRVLVIRSEPVGLPHLDLKQEWTQISAALDELVGKGLLAITELDPPTPRELRLALSRGTFHVLHYMGHGAFDRSRGGVLLFTDSSGRELPVAAEDLGMLLQDQEEMSLAVLNACDAGRTDPADPFAGVADTLVRRGIPAVVAMQFEVSDVAAIEFAPALYGALAYGYSIDAAVTEARKAISMVSPLEWVTPVLYLRGDETRLIDFSQEMPVSHEDSAAKRAAEADQLLQRHSDAEAEAAYQTAIVLDPAFALAYVGLGKAQARLHRYTEAEASCRKAIRLDPALAVAHANLGAVLRNLKRYGDAEAACREAVRLDPALAVAHANLGTVLFYLKRYGDAEAACREAVRLDPALAAGHIGLGLVLGDLKRYPEAEAEYREAIRLDRALAVAHNNLGRLLIATSRVPEAEAEYREAVRLDPALAIAHNGLGWALDELKRYPEAEAEYREAIRLDPASALPHNNLGKLLISTSRVPAAEAEFREAVRLDPALASAHNCLGQVLKDLKRYPEAEAEYREAIRLDPAFADAHNRLGWVLGDLKRYPEAEAEYREAIRLDPASALPHNNLGKLLISTSRVPEAEAEYRQAVRLDPALAIAHNGLGWVLSELKRYPEAEAEYREAIRLDPASALPHNNLGKLLIATNRVPAAEAELREAIRLDPAFTLAQKNLDNLTKNLKRGSKA